MANARHDAAGPPCTPPDIRLIEVSALQTKRGALSDVQDLTMSDKTPKTKSDSHIARGSSSFVEATRVRIRAAEMQQMVHCLAGRAFLNA